MKKIGRDFQGWDVNAMTLREIIDELGVTYTMDNGDEIIRKDRIHLLDAYPLVLEDDGMGYGVSPKYITTVCKETHDDKELEEKVFNVFIEAKHPSECSE